MAKIPKRIICLVTASVIICAHVPVAHAEALPNVLEGSATLADNIMSYYALSGSAVANTEYINTLYDSYGSSFGTIYDFAENGMLTVNNDGTWQATTALETAIENAPAYQSLGLDQIFNVSSQEAAAGGGIAASGAATLAGSLGGVASTGVLPLFGGVTAAYWGGIAIGNLINHLTGNYGQAIYNGTPINDLKYITSLPVGTSTCVFYNSSNVPTHFYYVPNGYRICNLVLNDSSNKPAYFIFSGNPDTSIKITEQAISTGSKTNFNSSLNSYGRGYKSLGFNSTYKISPTYIGNTSFFNSFRDGEEDINIFSPDIIGPDGNQKGNYNSDSEQYQVPNMKPQVDPGVQSGKPLTLQDWLNFANSVKNNNSNTNPLPDNKSLFDDLINAIKKAIPNPNPDPNPDPDPDPDPDPYHPPTPTPVPDPDYGDPNPDQPDFESETDIPDPVDTGNPWVTPDLLDKFPFCIPKDMIDMVKGFKSADRTAPHISWNFKSPVGHVDYTFNLDLEDFEDVATLLRALELAAFIVGLAFATRYLIGAL